MGLFEKALKFKKEKKGLYKRLLEARQNPKSLYLKAKELRKKFELEPEIQEEKHIETPLKEPQTIQDIQLPDYSLELEQKTSLDPEITETLPDPFVNWEDEARRQVEEAEKTHDEENIVSRFVESDDEIHTLPEELHVASQKRLDYYLSLFDINDELQEISTLDELFESLAFNIQEQIGARSVIVFGIRNFENLDYLENVITLGYEQEDLNIPVSDPFFNYVNNPSEIYYLNSLKENLHNAKNKSIFITDEKFNKLFNDFIITFVIASDKRIYSLFFVSSPLEQKDYIIDDLEFIRVLVKLALSRLKILYSENQKIEEIVHIKNFYEMSKAIYHFVMEVASKKTLDEVYEQIESFLSEKFGFTMFSFSYILPHEGNYQLFSGKNISIESIKKFRIDINSDFIGFVSNLTTIHNLSNFRNYKEIISSYSEEDLSLMEKFLIIPFIHLNWLIGFIIVHKMRKELTKEEEEIIVYFATLLAPIVTNIIIAKDREILFKDVFSPLQRRLEYEFSKAEETQNSFSVIDFRIKNLKRIIAINSLQRVEKFFKDFMDLLNQTLYQRDYITRMGHGRFIIILPGKSKEEANIFVKKLLQKIKDSNIFQESSIQPVFNYDVVTYPKDVDRLEKMLALLDN